MKSVKKKFLEGIADNVDYWLSVDCDERRKLEGLAFSIMVMIDGCSSSNDFQEFYLHRTPHKDCINLNTELHDELCKVFAKRGR